LQASGLAQQGQAGEWNVLYGPSSPGPLIAVLGIGRTLAFDLARSGRFPVRVIRLGRRVLVPVAELLEFLAVPPNDPPGQA
jgi:hypothetical protein